MDDEVQKDALALIDQRLTDAETRGVEPSVTLGPFLDVAIRMDEAVRRYGQELVDRAVTFNLAQVKTSELSDETVDEPRSVELESTCISLMDDAELFAHFQ